jgi:hypothetical protein
MELPPITLDPQRLSALNAKELAEFHKHLAHLPKVLDKAIELVNLHLLERERKIGTDDIVITCELCCGPNADQFFQDAYGPVWQAAKYFTCGIFGLDCSCNGGS